MCAKNHLLIFSSFLDIWENVEWPRFFGPPCMCGLTVSCWLHWSAVLVNRRTHLRDCQLSPPYERIKIGSPVENVRFLLLHRPI